MSETGFLLHRFTYKKLHMFCEGNERGWWEQCTKCVTSGRTYATSFHNVVYK